MRVGGEAVPRLAYSRRMGKPPLHETASVSEPPTDELRPQHGAWLRSVLEEVGVVTDASPLDQRRVAPLSGGADAHTYLVRCPGRDVVVKLNENWLDAEATALRAWKEHTPWVPEVLGAGTVPGTRAVKFLALVPMVNDRGEVVETVAEYLDRCPAGARDVGRELGVELHRLHQARCSSGFGNFADSPGAQRTYPTWNSYLEEFFMQCSDFVKERGVPGHRIEKVRAVIRACEYVEDACFLHGDVTVRNIAMRAYDPIRIGLFDPNPLCGDPSWDIAPMTNNVEYDERRHRSDAGASEALMRDHELLAGFWETYPQVVTEQSLLTAQLVQAVLQAEHRETARKVREVDDLDVEVAHLLIRDLIERILA